MSNEQGHWLTDNKPFWTLESNQTILKGHCHFIINEYDYNFIRINSDTNRLRATVYQELIEDLKSHNEFIVYRDLNGVL